MWGPSQLGTQGWAHREGLCFRNSAARGAGAHEALVPPEGPHLISFNLLPPPAPPDLQLVPSRFIRALPACPRSCRPLRGSKVQVKGRTAQSANLRRLSGGQKRCPRRAAERVRRLIRKNPIQGRVLTFPSPPSLHPWTAHWALGMRDE